MENDNNNNTTEDRYFDEEDEDEEDSTDIDVKVLTVGQQIGAGAYGMVYKGSYYKTEVAIKKIHPGEHQRELQKYLKREIAVLKNIKHPNIVQFVGVYYEQRESSTSNSNNQLLSNSTWIVTEYVAGGNLHERIKDVNTLFPFSLRFKLSLDIALAMAYLHSRDILFRDLKSKNILIDDSNHVAIAKVCDFGFARTYNKNKSRHLSICGTDDFMAPEVILGMDYDESADIFSFGVLCLELASRKKMSREIERGPNNAFEIPEDEARALIPDTMPSLFTELIIDCIKYNPGDRPTFPHIIHVLKQLVSLFPPPQPLENPMSPHSSPVIPRRSSMSSPFDRVMRKGSCDRIDFRLCQVEGSPAPMASPRGNRERSSTPTSETGSEEDGNTNVNNSSSSDNDNNNNNTSSTPAYADQPANSYEDDLDMEEEEMRRKLASLKERMSKVLTDLLVYIKQLSKELLGITEEEQITDQYDECRKVIEIKRVLNEVVDEDTPTTPRKNSGHPTTRVGIFLRSMEKSLQEIKSGLESLKRVVEREESLVEATVLARTVSKLKRIHQSQMLA
eukprot:gene13387-15751_t